MANITGKGKTPSEYPVVDTSDKPDKSKQKLNERKPLDCQHRSLDREFDPPENYDTLGVLLSMNTLKLILSRWKWISLNMCKRQLD